MVIKTVAGSSVAHWLAHPISAHAEVPVTQLHRLIAVYQSFRVLPVVHLRLQKYRVILSCGGFTISADMYGTYQDKVVAQPLVLAELHTLASSHYTCALGTSPCAPLYQSGWGLSQTVR